MLAMVVRLSHVCLPSMALTEAIGRRGGGGCREKPSFNEGNSEPFDEGISEQRTATGKQLVGEDPDQLSLVGS
jgi:hypothetical protein